MKVEDAVYNEGFLKLSGLNIESLWFPLVQELVKTKFSQTQTLKLIIDRTQWRDKNIFVISLFWTRRYLPLYWKILEKRGSSNIEEQKSIITQILSVFKDYKIIILGDREFGSVKLGSWLCEKQVRFVLRIKQSRYIKQESTDYAQLL